MAGCPEDLIRARKRKNDENHYTNKKDSWYLQC